MNTNVDIFGMERGRPRNIESPDALWQLFEQYQQSLETIEMEVPHVKFGTVTIKAKEPMTMEGFCSFGYDNGITIHHYVDNPEGAYDDFRGIVTRIKKKIFKHNFSRAAVGMYKENLIARQLGMTEKTENKNDNTHSGSIKIEVIKTDVPLANSEKDIKLD